MGFLLLGPAQMSGPGRYQFSSPRRLAKALFCSALQTADVCVHWAWRIGSYEMLSHSRKQPAQFGAEMGETKWRFGPAKDGKAQAH